MRYKAVSMMHYEGWSFKAYSFYNRDDDDDGDDMVVVMVIDGKRITLS